MGLSRRVLVWNHIPPVHLIGEAGYVEHVGDISEHLITITQLDKIRM